MQMQKQKLELPIEIICDKILYQRIETIEDNESIKVYLFPYKNIRNTTINFVIIDMIRCKANQNTKLKILNKSQFIEQSSQIYYGNKTSQILVYLISKQLLAQLLSEDSKQIRIKCPNNIKQINQILKECIIITLKIPSEFYELQDCNYSLQGYKFNAIGKIRQNWSYLNNGRITKAIFSNDNQKIKTELKQNITYSKNQLKNLLQLIQTVNTLTNKQNKQTKIIQELSVLSQNFIHHQKFISNSNTLLPIINFEIQLLCSLGRGQTCKNKISNSNIKSNSKITHNICINLAQGISHSQLSVKNKIQAIFTNPKTETSHLFAQNNLYLTNMPTKLVNPHFFLKSQFKEKFSQYYVKGLYEYFHYGDHNFNDQGWGCAYRSLQTLLSWFRLQQKLNLITVPTVTQIQNLIDLIDCTSPQKLSNSNTWIGATQVSWVVKKLTGYDCRILHIKDGKDIVQHAQMFRDHLQNVGTPIMYGGDQYAYSIVGINYSWKFGQISFLILDPHYNGSDKVDKIIEKKGICWRKPEEMFKKGVFYNFCLPII